MEAGPSTMWVIPLFGQAVNKKRGPRTSWVDEGRLEDALNPAAPLMIPAYECCFIGPIWAGMRGHISAPFSRSRWLVRGFSLWC